MDKLSESDLDPQEMLDWFRTRLSRHKRLVMKYARLIDSIVDLPGLMTQVREHDKSKTEPPEKIPYIFISWDHKEDDFEIPDSVDKLGATRHHILNNSHHPEAHDPSLDAEEAEKRPDPETRDWEPDEPIDARSMPLVDICEMVADWCAMSEELQSNTVKEWADEKINERWNFGEDKKNMIYLIISRLEEMDEAAKACRSEAQNSTKF